MTIFNTVKKIFECIKLPCEILTFHTLFEQKETSKKSKYHQAYFKYGNEEISVMAKNAINSNHNLKKIHKISSKL